NDVHARLTRAVAAWDTRIPLVYRSRSGRHDADEGDLHHPSRLRAFSNSSSRHFHTTLSGGRFETRRTELEVARSWGHLSHHDERRCSVLLGNVLPLVRRKGIVPNFLCLV